MKHKIHLQIRPDHRRNLSSTKVIHEDPSFLVSHVKKRSLPCRHRSLPAQRSPIRSVRSNDIIHTTIRSSSNNINIAKKQLSTPSSYTLPVIHQQNASEKSFITQKSIKLVENKVKPVHVDNIPRHSNLTKRISNNVANCEYSNQDLRKQNNPPSTTKNIHAVNQNSNIAARDSNRLNNVSDTLKQKKASTLSGRTSIHQSKHKHKGTKNHFRRYGCQRSTLCAFLTPLILLLVLVAVIALVIAFTRSKTAASIETTLTTITNTNTSDTITTTITTFISSTSTITTMISAAISNSTTILSTITTDTTSTITSTTVSTTSTAFTTLISTTNSTITNTMTDSTTTMTPSTTTSTETSISTTSSTMTTTTSIEISTSTTSSTVTTSTITTATTSTTSISETTTTVTSTTTITTMTTKTTTSSQTTTTTITTTTTTISKTTTSTTSTITTMTTSTTVTSKTTTTTATISTTTISTATSTTSITTTTITTSETTTTQTTTSTATTSTTITTESTITTTTTTTTGTSTSTSTTSVTTITTTTSTTSVPILNPCVSKIYWNVTGSIYAGTGVAGSGPNQLNSPSGIFLDGNDTLYISDSGNGRIMSYLRNAASGTMVAGTGVTGSTLNKLSSNMRYIHVDGNGSIYVADTNNDRVVRWANGGSTGVLVAGNGTAGISLNQVDYPYGVWVDSAFNVYVTEYSNQRVTKWPLGASAGIVVAGITNASGTTPDKLSSPIGLYYDETNQNLYISNIGSQDTVLRWRIGDPNGTVIAGNASNSGAAANQLNAPTGITLDQWQNLYVNDRSNNRIQLFCKGNLTGITIAGQGTSGTNFSNPFDVKLDSQLNLYVVDNPLHRVTKFAKL